MKKYNGVLLKLIFLFIILLFYGCHSIIEEKTHSDDYGNKLWLEFLDNHKYDYPFWMDDIINEQNSEIRKLLLIAMINEISLDKGIIPIELLSYIKSYKPNTKFNKQADIVARIIVNMKLKQYYPFVIDYFLFQLNNPDYTYRNLFSNSIIHTCKVHIIKKDEKEIKIQVKSATTPLISIGKDAIPFLNKALEQSNDEKYNFNIKYIIEKIALKPNSTNPKP